MYRWAPAGPGPCRGRVCTADLGPAGHPGQQDKQVEQHLDLTLSLCPAGRTAHEEPRTLAETLGLHGQAVRGRAQPPEKGSSQRAASLGSLVTMARGDRRLWACACTWSTWWGRAAQAMPGSLQLPRVHVVCSLRYTTISTPHSLCMLIPGSLQIRSHAPWARSPSEVKSPPREPVAPEAVYPLPLPPQPLVWPTLTGLHRSPSVFASISQMWWPSARKGSGSLVILSRRGGPQIAPGHRQIGVLR